MSRKRESRAVASVTGTDECKLMSRHEQEIQGLLEHISADEYPTWFKVGCALKHLGAQYDMFRQWSKTSEKFDPIECKNFWGKLPEVPRAGLPTLRRLAGVIEPAETFSAPPQEQLQPPQTEEERFKQVARFICMLFRSSERFEFCTGKMVRGRIVPGRNGMLAVFEEQDSEESIAADTNFQADILAVTTGCYVGLNPLRYKEGEDYKGGRDDMVTDFRVALLENDDLPLDDQWRALRAMKLPVLSVVNSGNKSMHILCRIDAGQNADLYRERVGRLYEYAEEHGFKPDSACRNPSRLTRCPGFMRGDKLQYVVSWDWGYPDWDSFEAAELTSMPIATVQPPAREICEPWIAELQQSYGPPFSINQQSHSIKVNEPFFAAYTLKKENLVAAEGRYWHYAPETGLWSALGDPALLNAIAKCVREFPVGGDAQTVVNADARICGNIKKFIVPSETSPFEERSHNRIHVPQGMLEIDEDGVVELKPFSPDYYSRNRSEINYDPKAQCPRFLHNLLEPALPQEDIDILQLYGGQCLLGDNFTQRLLVLSGTAGGGKGTIVNIIQSIIGAKNCVEFRTKQLDDRFEIARFAGKSLLVGSDVPSDFLLSKAAGRIKSLCGGDHLTGEAKNVQEGVTLEGRFNMIITANSRLRINVDGDAGAWNRRILWLPFEKPATTNRIDNFDQLLIREEGSGILNWMIQGAVRLLTEGMPRESRATRRVKHLLAESDSVMGFLQSEIVKDSTVSNTLSLDFLLTQYSSWCIHNDWNPLPDRIVKPKLKDSVETLFHLPLTHDIKRGDCEVRGFHGIRFRKKSDPSPDAPDGQNEVLGISGGDADMPAICQLPPGYTMPSLF